MRLDQVQGTVWLKQGRAKPVVQRHPWIFSGAVGRVEGDPEDGALVDVHDAGNNWLARGYINTRSQIRVRLLTWEAEEQIDGDFWRRRLAQALAARRARRREDAKVAYRVAHAESDYVPGLVVDRYGEWLAVQFLTLGVDRRRDEIVEALADLLAPRGIYERSDVDVRAKEGLAQRTGSLWGQEPPERVEIVEHDHRFLVDVRKGHKTGFYLDQRENRAKLVPACAGAEVLDAFAYTGACGVYAAAGGARRVTLVESAASALALARENFARNGFEAKGEWVAGDVFSVLRGYRAEGRTFDVIVLDPPKLASSRREVKSAARAYKDVNLLAFELLRPGGSLFTFSCSGAVSADLFQKIVFGAALDAGCRAQIVGRMTQGPDHPVALTFPEGAYLKGLIVRATSNQ